MNRLVLTVMLAAAVLAAGCAAPATSPEPAAPQQGAPQAEPAPDTSMIEHMSPEEKRAAIDPMFLIEVPVPKGEITRARAQGDTAWDYDISVDAEPAALAQWYREAYTGRGWQLVAEEPLGERVALTFRKAAAQSRVEVAQEGETPATATVVIGVGTEVLQTQ